MSTFMAGRIELAKETSLDAGQDKYRAYFVNTLIYAKYKADADTILTTDGDGDCIVTE